MYQRFFAAAYNIKPYEPFSSRTQHLIRSHLVRPKDALKPSKQDGVVYKIPFECGKVHIGETRRSMRETIKEHDRDTPLARTPDLDKQWTHILLHG